MAQIADADEAHCRARADELREVSDARTDLWLACADTAKQIAAKIRASKPKDKADV